MTSALGEQEETGATHRGTPPTLLVVAPALPPARVAEADHVLHECLHLAERGYQVHVLTTQQDGVVHPERLSIHAVMPDWSWRRVPVVLRTIRAVRPDVTLLYFLGTLFRYRTMVLFLPAFVRILRPGCRFVTQFSNLGSGAPKDGSWRSAFKRTLFRLLGPLRLGAILPLSHNLILLSEVYLDKLRDFPRSASAVRRSTVIPPPPLLPVAADPQAARRRGRSRAGVRDDQVVVSFFGRLRANKGLESLVEAIKLLRDEGRDVRCLLIGGFMSAEHFYWTVEESYEDRLLGHIDELGLTTSVTLTGEYAWESTEASEYLFATDVLVLPLHLGVHLYNSSFAAACAHGLPVILTGGHPPERVIEHRRNAFLLGHPSAPEIADAVREVVDDPQLRQQLVEGSNELARRFFDWEATTSRLTDLFECKDPA